MGTKAGSCRRLACFSQLSGRGSNSAQTSTETSEICADPGPRQRKTEVLGQASTSRKRPKLPALKSAGSQVAGALEIPSGRLPDGTGWVARATDSNASRGRCLLKLEAASRFR